MNNCPECGLGCNGETISDKCVKYTGPKIEVLGICPGMFLNEIEAIVLEAIQKSITLDGKLDVDLTCDAIKKEIGEKDLNLLNLIEALIKSQCTLKEALEKISAKVTADQSISFDTTGLDFSDGVTSPTRDQILQALVTKVSSLDKRVGVVEKAGYVKTSEVENIIKNYLDAQKTSSSTVTQYYSNFPPKIAFPYFDSLANFDSEGKGLKAKGFDNLFLCNGRNGTPDLRGFTLVGAIAGVPGGTLHASVDPNLPASLGYNPALNDKFGTPYATLAVDQLPSHTHDVVDPGHAHDFPRFTDIGQDSGNNGADGHDLQQRTDKTSTAKTGITIKAAGGGKPHDNRQPSHACYFVMAIY